MKMPITMPSREADVNAIRMRFRLTPALVASLARRYPQCALEAWSGSSLDHLAALTERQFRVRPEEITLSLSGGWDSRYALALLHQHGLRCSHYTFGLEGSEEVLKAAAISAQVTILISMFSDRLSKRLKKKSRKLS